MRPGPTQGLASGNRENLQVVSYHPRAQYHCSSLLVEGSIWERGLPVLVTVSAAQTAIMASQALEVLHRDIPFLGPRKSPALYMNYVFYFLCSDALTSGALWTLEGLSLQG